MNGYILYSGVFLEEKLWNSSLLIKSEVKLSEYIVYVCLCVNENHFCKIQFSKSWDSSGIVSDFPATHNSM